MTRAMGLAAGWLLLAGLLSAPVVAEPLRPDLQVTLMVDGSSGNAAAPQRLFLLKVGFSGEVEAGGNIEVGLPPLPDGMRLSSAAHAKLAALLNREQFFTRSRRNLGCVPDLGGRSIEVWQGKAIRSLSFCAEATDLPLPELQSALRVWYGVLSIAANGRRVRVLESDRRLLSRAR